MAMLRFFSLGQNEEKHHEAKKRKPGSANTLLTAERKDKLTKILTCHTCQENWEPWGLKKTIKIVMGKWNR